MSLQSQGPNLHLEHINLILGLTLTGAAFFSTSTTGAFWDAIVVGSMIACFSLVASYRYGVWADWSNLTLGCWAIIAPFALHFQHVQSALWIHVTIGSCITVASAIQIYRVGDGRPGATSGTYSNR